MEWAAFWLALAVIACANKVPSWIKASAEAKCAHEWFEEHRGQIIRDGKPGGNYSVYRCSKCGAERKYN